MKYGYARVSTKGQARDGNSLEAQATVLMAQGVQEENLFIDKFTGKQLDRPEFNRLLDVLATGDTLVVTKIDRFARTMVQASNLITRLIDKGICIHILNLGIMDNSTTSTLIRNVFLAFAEFERSMIVERTQEGKAIARLRPGYVEGRPPLYGKQQIAHALELLDTNTYRQVEQLTGISKSTLIRAKRTQLTRKEHTNIDTDY